MCPDAILGHKKVRSQNILYVYRTPVIAFHTWVKLLTSYGAHSVPCIKESSNLHWNSTKNTNYGGNPGFPTDIQKMGSYKELPFLWASKMFARKF